MINRKLATICALLAASCPAAFAQEAPREKPVFEVTPVPNARVPSTIDVEGRTLQLQVVEESDDPQRPAYHYASARIRNVPDGYARFVISGDYIVGTLVTPEATYRALPATDGRPLALHLLARSNDPAARFRLISEPWARAIERRHVQMERLAYARPGRVDLNDAGQFFSAEGGNFGTLAGLDAASVAAAMRNLAELTYAPDPLELQITRVQSLPQGTRVEFRQTIRGIALFRTHEVTTDAQGRIVALSTQFVDPAMAGNRRVIPEAEGLEAALEQIGIETSSPVTGHELLNPPELFYSVEPGRKLVPYYTFSIRPLPGGVPVGVRVNAHSREARLLVNPD